MKLKRLKQINIFYKVNAGALYYALFISFVVAVLLTMLILHTFIYNSYVSRKVLQDQVVLNVESGINLVCLNPYLIDYNQWEKLSLFENNVDSVHLLKKHWGVYDVLIAKSKRRSYRAEKIALLGDHLGKKEDVALYLADKKKYLSLSGTSRLKGSCYLPKLGIKRAYIEGQGYQNRELVYGTIQQSNSELPELNSSKTTYLEDLLKPGINKQDSIVILNAQYNRESFTNSFDAPTLVLYSDEITRLDGFVAEGNVILKFDKEITIGTNCNLRDIIIVAPSVIFEDGFTGQIQVFAENKITLNSSCKLKYPSALAVMGNSSSESKTIVVGKNTILAGGILLYTTNTGAKLEINEFTKIYGTVYCKGFVQLKGSIFGSLYCEGFTLKTASSLYENHLLNATIDYSKLPKDFVGVNLIQKPINQKIIKILD